MTNSGFVCLSVCLHSPLTRIRPRPTMPLVRRNISVRKPVTELYEKLPPGPSVLVRLRVLACLDTLPV
jgi:hypothetical protein